VILGHRAGADYLLNQADQTAVAIGHDAGGCGRDRHDPAVEDGRQVANKWTSSARI
jgi:hypothetical protein